MSNNRNLGNIATAITNATSGQVLTSQGSGVATFADAGGTGVTVHNNQAAMLTDAASADEGSLHYETANNKLYVKQSSGFFLLASITNTAPTVSGFTETTGSGSATTIADNGTFTLTSGSNTVITLTATDPDLETLVYSATVTSGTASNVISSPSLPISNQSGNTFTLTPVTSGAGGTVTIRFDVSDGNNVVNKTHSFSIGFTVVDSKYTTLLATATSTGGNSTIEDSSSNSHSITVTGDAYAGTFSPYRSGDYAVEFDSSDYLTIASHSDFAFGSGAFTIQFWIKPLSWNNCALIDFRPNSTNGPYPTLQLSGSGQLGYYKDGGGFGISQTSTTQLTLNEWQHIIYQRSGTTGTLYRNGSSIGSWSDSTNYSQSLLRIAYHAHNGAGFIGQLSNVRITTASDTVEIPTTPLTANSDTVFLGCSLPYFGDSNSTPKTIIVSSDPKIVAVGPYDYSGYSATDHGGSVYFDGNQDYILGNSGTNLGTGNWTVEGWMYITDTSSGRMFIDFRPFSNGDYVTLKFESSDSKMYFFAGNSNRIASNDLIVANSWVHIALVRSSGTIKMYINGNVQTQTYASTANYLSHSARPVIGINGDNTTSDDMYGYISDVRVAIGTAHYTTNFTPPTAPLSSTGAELHIKGTDASIIDKSQINNIDLGSTSIVGNSTTKWSGANSIYINSMSNNSDIITIPAGVLDASKPFTIEMWLKTLSGSASGFWSIDKDSGNTMRLKMRGDDRLEFYHGGNNAAGQEILDVTNTYTLNNTDFYHVAITRDANAVFYLHQNGIKLGNFTANGDYDSSDTSFVIGKSQPATFRYMNGYIQDFRITQGLARYTAADETSNIPTAPLEG